MLTAAADEPTILEAIRHGAGSYVPEFSWLTMRYRRGIAVPFWLLVGISPGPPSGSIPVAVLSTQPWDCSSRTMRRFIRGWISCPRCCSTSL